jgi:hypothetical protein
MTPWEAATGKKPDLSGVREWGERVWVRVEKGDKLGGRVREGRWVGVDEKSKGFRIYWPDSRKVTVERNVYHDKTGASADRLEGEDWEFEIDSTDLKSTPEVSKSIPPAPSTSSTAPPAPPAPPTAPPAPVDAPELEPIPQKRVRTPSRYVRQMLDRTGSTSARPSDPLLPKGIQQPSLLDEANANDPELNVDWMMVLEDGLVMEEYALEAEVSLMEALEPEKEMIGFADADGSMAEDRHAITGYAFIINGGAVSWTCKRQEIVSLSTTESEYVAATHAAKEGLWLRSLISQLFEPINNPTPLLSDNQSAIALSKDHQYHARTKHIDIRFHFIRWVIAQGSLCLVYCPTEDMVADVLTKALPSAKTKHFATELGLGFA